MTLAVGCGVIVLYALLCGCDSRTSEEVHRDALAYHKPGVVHLKAGRYDEAIAAFKEAIAIKPDYDKAHYNIGVAYYRLGRHAEALAAFKKAIAIKPHYGLAHYNMGVTYEKLKQNKLAVAAYEKFISLEPRGEKTNSARKAVARLRR